MISTLLVAALIVGLMFALVTLILSPIFAARALARYLRRHR